MVNLSLNAEERKVFGKKTEILRKKGLIPAVVYGSNTEPISLMVSEKNFLDVYKKAGETDLIDLKINKDGQVIEKKVMIQDVDYHYLYDGKVIHVDFYEVALDKPVTVYVPIEIEGESESPALKKGGVLIRSMNELMIEALPQDVPHHIKVDVSHLEDFDQTIYVNDLKLSEKIKVLVDKRTPVVTISAPMTEEELEKELKTERTVETVEVAKEEEKAKEEKETAEAEQAGEKTEENK